MILTVISVCLSFLIIIITIFKWRFNYWKRQGIPQLEPTIPFGDMRNLLLQKFSLGQQYIELYKIIKSKKLKYAGTYMSFKPKFIVIDPELTKTMLIRDFSHFVNHGVFLDPEKDPLSAHLFHLEDDEWKMMRQKLTPIFSSGKIKMMFDTINVCALNVKTMIEDFATKQKTINIKEMIACFATDVIASIAFGIDLNSLENPDSEFRYYGRKIFERTLLESIKFTMILMMPKSLLKYTSFKLTKVDVEKFFMNAVHEMVNLRETKNIYRKDFLQLLVELKNQPHNGKSNTLTMNQLAAQAYVFFIAGFETVSTTLNFLLFELASNQSLQNKLRNEIKTVLDKHEGKITYDAIKEMTYMDNVINESMRKHPPLEGLPRKCNKDYKIPDSDIIIKKGTDIVFAIEAMQMDSDYYPYPEKFDPDRFANEDKSKRPWFSFGEGPRICIGMRFAQMETKTILTHIIKDFKVKLNEKTTVPFKYVPGTLIKTVKDAIWLDFEKI